MELSLSIDQGVFHVEAELWSQKHNLTMADVEFVSTQLPNCIHYWNLLFWSIKLILWF